MKKIISICLAASMLLALVVMFASCAGTTQDGNVTVSNNIVSVDLKSCGVVFDRMLGSAAMRNATSVTNLLEEYAGISARAQKGENDGDEKTADGPMILIGDVGYAESNSVIGGLGENGWAVRVMGNKIVIAGANKFLTRVALAYFLNKFFKKDAFEGTVLTMNESASQKDVGRMDIADENGEGLFALVYNSWVDDHHNGGETSYSYTNDNNPTTGGDCEDYIYTAVEEVRSLLSDLSGAKKRSFLDKLDTSDQVNDYEVLVGYMQREDYRVEMEKLSANEYGVCIKDGKVMLLAWSDATLPYALDIFKDMMSAFTVEGEDGDYAYLPAACTIVETVGKPWADDFPKPEAEDLYLHGAVDVGDRSMEYVYAGEGATEATYLAYCKTLEAAGYELIGGENYKPLNTQNIFRYYLNEETGSTLYVYYSPYEFAEEQKVNDVLASIRIVASNTEYVDLPDDSILNPDQTWVKHTETMVTSLTHNYSVGSWGLAYIITLEDGSFVIFDGGIGIGLNNVDNHVRIWNVLNSLYKNVFGHEPTTSQPIHVRAWMLTHEHADHMNVMINFIKTYGPNGLFRFDNVLFNATSESECYNCTNPEYKMREQVASMKKAVNGGFNYLKVHTGQKFYFANCEIDIMATHEDIYPKHLEYFNNSTTTFKTILTSTQGTSGTKSSNDAGNTTTDCIWLGDIERVASRRLRAMWGENIEADQVQVAHHGYNGAEASLYTLINAELVWWPYAGSRYVYAGAWQNHSVWYNHACWQVAYGVPAVKMVVMSDGYDYTIKFTTAGIDYDNVYDANTWEKMTPDGVNLIDKRA